MNRSTPRGTTTTEAPFPIFSRRLLVVLFSVLFAGSASAETLCGDSADVSADTIVVVGLATGDTLVVTFAGCDEETALVDHQLLGRLALEPDAISEVVAGQPGEDLVLDVRVFTDGEAPDPGDAVTAVAEVEADDAADIEEEAPKLWESQAEFGLNGSQGNSERLSVRVGGRTKRVTERQELTLSAIYTRSDETSKETVDNPPPAPPTTKKGSSNTTEHKALVKGLNDWLFPDSPWRYFVGGTAEYDELQNFDARVTLSTGPGYSFIDNDRTTLIGRAGLGTSWKIGGDDEDGFFELVFGYNFEHKFTDSQKIISTAAIYPNMTETGEYRAVATVAYDLKVAQPAALTLRLGIEDRYDSTIEDTVEGGFVTEEFDKNDLDYYAALLWDF